MQIKYLIAFLLLTTTVSWSQVLTAEGDQLYCPEEEIKIVTGFKIVTPLDNTLVKAIYIQVSIGYVQNEDILKLTGSNNPSIKSKWNASQGKLVLTGSASAEDYETAVKNITFKSDSKNPTNKEFSITIDDKNYLPLTEHYYEFVPDKGITWTAAKTAAEKRTYFGLQGYLATLTSPEEAQLCGKQAEGAGWIGGTDKEKEGVWKWVTGPEGENGGTVFWNGGVRGTTPNYANWNKNEPNNLYGREHYAHITDPSMGVAGTWNDLKVGGDAPGIYHPKGYIVEYGGMPGDPNITIATSSKIYTGSIIETTSGFICDGGVVTLKAIASQDATVLWYDASEGGTFLYEGTIFETPYITETTTYYAVTDLCPERKAVTATVIETTLTADAPISLDAIKILDNNDNNTVIISKKVKGFELADYEFSLESAYGTYQDEPSFTGVKAGFHTLYIRGKNACAVSQLDFFILGVPKFFTPNNDGVNDTWHVQGLGTDFKNESVITIFDRYGKLLKQMSAITGTWDGTFNGKMLPNSDYWYVAQLIDFSGAITIYRGHFSLVR